MATVIGPRNQVQDMMQSDHDLILGTDVDLWPPAKNVFAL